MIRKLFISVILFTLAVVLFPGNPRDKKDDKPEVLSLAEARDRVISLQKERQDMKSRLLLQKKIALCAFELEKKILKDIINTPIPPKDEFETTVQYEERLREHRGKIKPAKIRYEADYNAIREKFDKELTDLDKKYKHRLETILNNTYPADGLKVVPIQYNTDEQVYRLKVIEKDGRAWEYHLSTTPRIARGIYQRRNSLKVEGVYANIDALFLINVRLIDPIVGKPDLEAKTFRAACKVVNFKELIRMLHRENFFDTVDNPTGEFLNLLEFKTLRGDNVVIDRASGLMWHRSGSSRHLQFEEANEWVKELNSRGYAGYRDWRLPTSEEAASLLVSYQPSNDSKTSARRAIKSFDQTFSKVCHRRCDETPVQRNFLYIDPLFSSMQANIWTCDKTPGGRVWAVLFSTGNVADCRGPMHGIYVRPVRSGRVKGKLVYKKELHEKIKGGNHEHKEPFLDFYYTGHYPGFFALSL